MADLQAKVEGALRSAVHTALGDELPSTGGGGDVDPLVRPATDPKFGDYQANVAMPLAKSLKQKPRDIAQRIVEALSDESLFEHIEIAGPGFINMTLSAAALQQQAAAMLADPRLGMPAIEPSTIVVDYSGPNVAKEMHVGHLRPTNIGDAIVRVLEFVGHRVIRQNHLGDWGTQFGMLIEHLEDEGYGQDRPLEQTEIGDLNALYQAAKKKFDSDPDFADRARRRVVLLQQGDEATLEKWRFLEEESKRHFNEVYRRFNVLLTDEDVRGESFYNDMLAPLVDDLDKAGLLKESRGARVVFPEGFKDREGEPAAMIVQKSDGGYLYATTDLAAARYRIDELDADRLIYVTDARQAQHFAMIFQTLREASWAKDVRLDHVPFGAVLGPDRRPFKTRSGEPVRLRDLLDQAHSRAAAIIEEKDPDLPAEEREQVARAVGIGALKYADLATDRVKDYVFEWDRMLAFDGNTAPYLQYSYTRIRSIFRKGGIDPDAIPTDAVHVTEPAERALLLKLGQWAQVNAAVADSLQPHRLCTFLYELATAYHQFYEQCPVLTAPDEATKRSRLALCHLVARTLKQGLGLLGIETVERM